MSPPATAPVATVPSTARKVLNDRVAVIVHRGASGAVLTVEPARDRTPTHQLLVTPHDRFLVLKFSDPIMDEDTGRPRPGQPAPTVTERHLAPTLTRAYRLASVCPLAMMKLLTTGPDGVANPVSWASRLRLDAPAAPQG
ncbi:hypothetical protein LG293_17815 (plasmid) [Citricoccus nitrophenolicus]